MKRVPKRLAATIINSLKGGVVPRIGLEYITVGRKDEVESLVHDVEIVGEEGATFRFIVGRYGSGKSFLIQIIRNYCTERNFVVVDADLSNERKLAGKQGQGLSTYRELIKNMSTKTKPDGGALQLILEKWISKIQSDVMINENIDISDPKFTQLVSDRIYATMNNIEDMVYGFEFARVISLYWKAYLSGNDEMKSNSLKWFRGEFSNKTEAKNCLGISLIVNDDNWYDFLKLFSIFLVNAGYNGLFIFIDELVNIYKIPNTVSRQYNYEKILTMYNDVLQGKAKNIGIIMGGTPQCIEDEHKGVFSYEALKSRLETGKFANDGLKNMLSPIIRLQPLSYEETYILIERIADIHATLYGYELMINKDEYVSFLEIEYNRIGEKEYTTVRGIIRDFIELLDLVYQNPNKSIMDIMKGAQFKFSNENSEEEIEDSFQEFEV